MEQTIFQLPLLPVKGIAVLPGMAVTIDIKREKTRLAVQDALERHEGKVLIFMQKEQLSGAAAGEKDTENSLDITDLYSIGVRAFVTQMIKLPDGKQRINVTGLERVELIGLETEPFWHAVAMLKEVTGQITRFTEQEQAALRESIGLAIEQLDLPLTKRAELKRQANSGMKLNELADLLVRTVPFASVLKQAYLSEDDECKRIIFLLKMLNERREIDHIRRDLNDKVRARIDKNQRDFIMREQMKVIQEELGEDVGSNGDELLKAVEQLEAPAAIKEKLQKEIKRMQSLPFGNQEGAVLRTYIETMLEMPWDKKGEENNSLADAARVLEEDHYGLEKIKERILDYLAVRILNGGASTTLLCLVGPPGTGKTSIARSIARALGRKYVRISLGGVHDEAEIRGHRKTYIGAMPGRIANAMKQAGIKNPLILLDEIDKMGSDYRGDPASAMLEVLDSEQNIAFRDHYLEEPMDLSQVLFIATANDASRIPAPLYDRMEILELGGYTENEKLHIGMDYLVDKQRRMHGLQPEQLVLTEDALHTMIRCYTREAGVRSLERRIGEVCRKLARRILEQGTPEAVFSVDTVAVTELLGKMPYPFDPEKNEDQIGVVHGLAWTSVGGDTLDIEVNVMPGKGDLRLTGKLGDVMKESAMTALSYVRSVAEAYQIPFDFFEVHDIHIHVPEGAVPKDGPSAGITLATAILSAVIERKVRGDVAMTGEVTLRGRVLPIGGLKEKLLAAKNAHMSTVLVPEKNRPDVAELSQEITDGLDICFVAQMQQVLAAALYEG